MGGTTEGVNTRNGGWYLTSARSADALEARFICELNFTIESFFFEVANIPKEGQIYNQFILNRNSDEQIYKTK